MDKGAKVIAVVVLVFLLYAMFKDPVGSGEVVKRTGTASTGLFSSLWEVVKQIFSVIWQAVQAIGTFFDTLLGRKS